MFKHFFRGGHTSQAGNNRYAGQGSASQFGQGGTNSLSGGRKMQFNDGATSQFSGDGMSQFRGGGTRPFRGVRTSQFSRRGINQFNENRASQFSGGRASQLSGDGARQFSGDGTSQISYGTSQAIPLSRGGTRGFGKRESYRIGQGGRGYNPSDQGRTSREMGYSEYSEGGNSNFGQVGRSSFKHKLEHDDYPNRKVGRYTRPEYDELFEPIYPEEVDSFAGAHRRNDADSTTLSELQAQLKQQQDMLMNLQSELMSEKQRNAIRPPPFTEGHQVGFPGYPQPNFEAEQEMILLERLKARRLLRLKAEIALREESEFNLLMRQRQSRMAALEMEQRNFQFGGPHPRGRGRPGIGGWDRNDRGGGQSRSFRGRGVERGHGQVRGKDQPRRGKPIKNLNITAEAPLYTDEVLKGKLSSLVELLKADPAPEAGKSDAVDGAMGKLGMKAKFEIKEFYTTISEQTKFTASLHFDRVFLSRGLGNSKKAARLEVYCKAFDVLQSKSADEIFKQVDPGVDSSNLSSVEPPKPEELQASLTTLQEYIREHAPKMLDNKITVLDCMVRSSRCRLKLEYVDSTLRLKSGVIVHKGSLFLGGTLIAEGISHRFKDTKLDTFENGYKTLISRSANTLIKGTDVEGHATAEELEKMGRKMPGPSSKKISFILPASDDLNESSTLMQKFKSLTYGMIHSKQILSNVVNNIDLLCNRVFLQPICFYSKVPCANEPTKQTLLCDLYLSGVYIATGNYSNPKGNQSALLFTSINKLWDRSPMKKEVQLDAYNKAHDVLTTKSAPSIVKHHKKIKQGEQPPGTFDRVVKGKGGEETSNQKELLGKPFIPDGREKTVDDLIIMEQLNYVADRERFAFAIMVGSATINGMLMEWEYSENPGNDRTKRHCCKVTLQKKEIGRADANNKPVAKITACYNAMKSLFKTQPIIQCLGKSMCDLLTWEVLESDAVKWLSGAIEKSDDQPMDEDQQNTAAIGNPDCAPDEEVDTETEQPEQSADEDKEIASASGKSEDQQDVKPGVMKYIRHLFEELKQRDDLTEITFGHDYPEVLRMAIIELALEMGMNLIINHAHGSFRVGRAMDMREMVDCLKKHGGKSGRYSLLTESGIDLEESGIDPEESGIDPEESRIDPEDM